MMKNDFISAGERTDDAQTNAGQRRCFRDGILRVKRRVFVITAALTVALSCLLAPFEAYADNIASGTDWSLADDGLLSIASDAGMSAWATWVTTGSNLSTARGNASALFIGNAVTSVPAWAFQSLNNLASVTFEPTSQVASIGDHAFSLTGLSGIEIPASVTSIDAMAFAGAPLTGEGITVEEGNYMYSVSVGGALLERSGGGSVLHTFPEGKTGSYTVETGVTKIGASAFYGTHLTSLTVPAAVTEVGTGAFGNSGLLKTVTFESATPPTGLAAGSFQYTNISFIIVPAGAEAAYEAALSGLTDVADIVVEIGASAVNAGDATELGVALAKPYPTTITVTADFSITTALPMNADHTLVIPAGKTVTATVNNAISIGTTSTGAHTLTMKGGGTFVSSMANGSGNALSGSASELNLENITINLTNTNIGGLSVKTVNAGNGALINLNSAGGTLINIQNGYTFNVNAGSVVNIQDFSSTGISNAGGVLHINGGTINVGAGAYDNWGINNTGSGLLKYTSGTLNATAGSAINLSMGSKVDGLNGKFKDRGTTFTASGEVAVGDENAAPSATGLTNGLYIWDGSVFAKEVITITGQPQDATVDEGSTVSLSVTATATNGNAVSYQWQSYAGGWTYNDVYGATSAVFSIPSTLAAGTYYYRCKLDAAGCVTAYSKIVFVAVKAAGSVVTGTIDIGGQTGLDLAADHSDTGWSWTASTATLTLDGAYSGSDNPIAIVCPPSDNINLVLTADVSIGSASAAGISVGDGSSPIGGGSLTIKAGVHMLSVSSTSPYNAALSADGGIAFESGAVNVAPSSGSAITSGYGDISVGGSANVTATSTSGAGMYAPNGNIIIGTSGAVTVKGGAWAADTRSVNISGGTVVFGSVGDNNGNIDGDLAVSGGIVTVNGTVSGTITHTGGTLNGVTLATATGTIDIGGQTALDLATNHSGTGWSWTASTSTLALDATYTGEAISINCLTADNVNLVYTGNVGITSATVDAVFCQGNLTVNESGSGGTLTLEYSGDGIYGGLTSYGELTVSSGAVVASSAGASDALSLASPIYANWGVTIDGSASVTANATGANASGTLEASGIITANGAIDISTSGTVTANGYGEGYALSPHNLVTGRVSISGGTVNLTGKTISNRFVDITGGTVNANDGAQSVYLLTLDSISVSTNITDMTSPAGYNYRRMRTTADGKLCLWLPVGNHNIALEADPNNYTATTSIAANHLNAVMMTLSSTNAVVSIDTIRGVTPPVAGAMPVTAVTETTEYTGMVTWRYNVGGGLLTGPFAEHAVYDAWITLTAKSGYTFIGLPANFFAVEGTSLSSNAANAGAILATFPATGDAVVTYGVSIGTFAGGSVSADKTSATENDIVTLTITCDAGYELSSISAHKNGDEGVTVALTGAGNATGSTRTFTMPAYGVTVTATFRLTDAASVDADKAALTWDVIKGANTSQTDVTTALSLPLSGANGTGIAWASDNTAVIGDNGAVTRPSYTEGDASVTLTATVSKGAASDNTTTFTLTVTKLPQTDAEAVAAAKAALTWDVIRGSNTLESAVTTALALSTTGAEGTTVAWTSSNTSVIDDNGAVTRPPYTDGDATVTLTADITKGSASDNVVFTLTVTAMPDSDAPVVTATSPANGATNVAITTSLVSVTFDEAIDTIASGAVSLVPASGHTLVNMRWSGDKRTVSYDISGLAYGTMYTFNISGFKDESGNTMAAVTSGHSFTTIGKENTPAAVIDYAGERLGNLVASAAYTINAAAYTADASGGINIAAGWFGQTLSVVKKGDGASLLDSDAQTLAIPARPNAPSVSAVNETTSGANDGQITGVSAAMEYRRSDATLWTPITADPLTGLAAGDYHVRLKATASSFSGATAYVTIAAGTAETRVLTVTAPVFAAEEYGYAIRPAAKPIIIANSGNSVATISSVTVSPSVAFDIAGSGATVAAGGQVTSWTIQPKAGLGSATYAAVITVTYDGTGSATATDDVSFTVNSPTDAQAPVIAVQPQGATVYEGDNVTLTVDASVDDGGTLSYLWYRNTANSNTGGAVIGDANASSYSPPTGSAGVSYYYVTITNTNATVNGVQTAAVTSDAAGVTVNSRVDAETPYISSHPQDRTVDVGDQVTLSVSASVGDGGTLSYQWYGNTARSNTGGQAINGATGSSYSPSTSTEGAAYYYVAVTNTNAGVSGAHTATARSNAATVTVNPQTYTVTAVSTGNGSITATPSSARAGTTVTLALTPADGYEPATVTAHRTGSASDEVILAGSGDTRTFTMPAYGVTVSATFAKTEAQLNREAVDAAKAAIESGTYRVTQATANDEAATRTWLVNTLNVLFGASHNAQFRSTGTPIAAGVAITALTPATAGTEDNVNGTDGTFAFEVSLAKGEATATATFDDGVIIATPHASTPVKRIEAVLIGDLNVRILNTGNVATGSLALLLTGADAAVFTLPQSTVSDLSAGDEAYIALTLREGLATGTYTATLTIDGEGIETVEVEITHVVTPVGIAAPQAPALNARAENGMLYVSGLKAGKTWSVYNLSGRLLYQSKAVGEEAVISLPVRSMYIIVSGDASVKVVNR